MCSPIGPIGVPYQLETPYFTPSVNARHYWRISGVCSLATASAEMSTLFMGFLGFPFYSALPPAAGVDALSMGRSRAASFASRAMRTAAAALSGLGIDSRGAETRARRTASPSGSYRPSATRSARPLRPGATSARRAVTAPASAMTPPFSRMASRWPCADTRCRPFAATTSPDSRFPIPGFRVLGFSGSGRRERSRPFSRASCPPGAVQQPKGWSCGHPLNLDAMRRAPPCRRGHAGSDGATLVQEQSTASGRFFISRVAACRLRVRTARIFLRHKKTGAPVGAPVGPARRGRRAPEFSQGVPSAAGGSRGAPARSPCGAGGACDGSGPGPRCVAQRT